MERRLEPTSLPTGSDEAATAAIASVLSRMKRSGKVWLALFVIIVYSSWTVYYYQYESLPTPLNADQAGKRGFSEEEAMKHAKSLTELGPHPVGSNALDLAIQYVLAASEKIKGTAHWEVDVQVDLFHSKSGVTRLESGLFVGKTLVYSDLSHIILRILPKYSSQASDNSILVSSHIDTVFSTEGAGDCSSCVAVMLELARGVSQWAHGFENAVIFLFNTGEEEGLSGAHSFVTQHPWSDSVRMAIDLEAMGIGGKSSIFQAGPNPWAIENFALSAKHPSGQIAAQDVFSSGLIKSATDFQIYKEMARLSGLDFAYTDNSAVYHTKNDRMKFLRPGSLQHLGDNMLAFLLQTATSPHFPKGKTMEAEESTDQNTAIFFDILGTYMIIYRRSFANILHNSVILQSLLIWAASLFMGGYPAAISLTLSCLSIFLMWIFSLGFSAAVAFFLPFVSLSPVPYVATPWLVVGLFAMPAFLGALTGQHLGFLILQLHLSHIYSKKNLKLSPNIQADVIKLEAERWLFKAGFVQWLILLIVGNYFRIGSTYLALVWLVSPAFAYGLLEATLTPMRLPKPLKIATLLMSLIIPIIISAGIFIRLAGLLIGVAVRFDRNAGSSPVWAVNIVISVYIAIVICLTSVYLLSYIHFSGAKKSIIIAAFVLFGLSLTAVSSGLFPPFTEDTSRAVNVVHVVDATKVNGGKQELGSYISLFSNTPGKLTKEAELIKEGFNCGGDEAPDFVTFSVKYGCWTYNDTDSGWSQEDVPILHVNRDAKGNGRETRIFMDTKTSTRWALAINTEEIEDFSFSGENEGDLIPLGKKSSVDGWHIVQYAGGKKAPTRFNLTLYRAGGKKAHPTNPNRVRKVDRRPLLKLRTDVNRLTPKAERVVRKLPPWCSLFGKSTSPYTLAFLTSLPLDF